MAKAFHHFQGGFEIDDWTINDWIGKCLDAIVKGGETHWSISSGDTVVISLEFDSEIQVIVANNAGKSQLRFSLSPGWEDPIEWENYVRPVKVAT